MAEEKKFFVMLALSSGRSLIGVVTEDRLASWRKGSYLDVEQPKMLLEIPAGDKGVQIAPVPVFPIKVEQSEMMLYPEILNVVGEVIEDERTGSSFCQGEDKLFPAYKEAIKSWRSEISGIHLAGANEMPSAEFPTGDSPPGVIPFNPKR